MPSNIVTNSSPPIYLFRLGLLDVLPKLYSRILVPNAVLEEHREGRERGHRTPDLTQFDWVEKRSVQILSEFASNPKLHRGEIEALSLAKAVPSSIVLLDEASARAAAQEHGIKVMGTLAVLIAAKKGGLLEQLRPKLDELLTLGFHMQPKLYQEVLAICGEHDG